MNTLVMDLRYAVRMLRNKPGFTAVVLVTLALGIGANTALFSIVNAVLLRPLPYKESARLVYLGREMPELKEELLGSIDYFHWKDRTRTLESMTAFENRGDEINLAGGEIPERVKGNHVTREFFETLGVRPILGRAFNAEEDQPGGPRTVILLHGFWQRRFGSNPGVIGETLVLNDEPRTVVGVMPAGFKFPGQPDLDLLEPMQLDRSEAESGGIRRIRIVSAIGRLRSGTSVAQALEELQRISAEAEPPRMMPDAPGPNRLMKEPPPPESGEMRVEIGPGPGPGGRPGGEPGSREFTRAAPPSEINNRPMPAPDRASGKMQPGARQMYTRRVSPAGLLQEAQIRVTPLQEKLTGNVRPALLILLGAVGFVLLIACVNVANLLSVRATERRREIAVRAALGARRGRLVLQLLVESVVLGVGGGILGLIVAYWGVKAFIALMPGGAVGNVFHQVGLGIDAQALGFMAVVSVLTGLGFGIAPAFAATRIDLNESLKDHGTAASSRRPVMRSTLVVVELTLALVLLSGAGLLLNSFARLLSVDLGFRAERVLTIALDLSSKRYPEQSQRRAFFQRLLDQVRSLPGVESAGVSTSLPLSQATMAFKGLQIEGRPQSLEDPVVYASTISPGYFPAIGMRLMMGRFFDEHDDENSPRIAIINEAMASFFWPGENAVGKRFRIGPVFGSVSIAGIVANVRRQALESEARPEIYLPSLQVPPTPFIRLAIRTLGDPAALAPAVRKVVASIDSQLAVYDVATMSQEVSRAIAPRRFNLLLLGSFAALALLLAAVGMYGVMDYAVAQRTQEIGVRLALGAQRRDVLKMIIVEGMALGILGVVAGLLGSLAVTRVLSSQLYGVSATDLTTYSLAAAVLALVALAASYIPADKAMKIDPVEALRYQ